MKNLILILLGILFVTYSNATNIQVSGNVSGHWDVDTVLVMDDLLIPSGEILSINSGVKVIFQGHYQFKVEGLILANGQENDSVSFSVADTTGFYNIENTKGGWAGFWFEPKETLSDSSVFEYCHFSYGKAVSEDSVFWYGGAVFVHQYQNLRFYNCTFENNKAYKSGGGIYCHAASIKIEHCDFISNSCGTDMDYGYGGGLCLVYSKSRVKQNYFANNMATGVGGGMSFEYSNPRIESNVFYDNYTAIGGGLCCLRSEQSAPIVNNLFYRNKSLHFGGGVAFLEAHSLFVNNTVVENLSSYGGGFYFNAAAKPIIKNSILWNNTCATPEGHQAWLYDVYSAPQFYYNNIEGGFEDFGGSGFGSFIGVYENNLDSIPLFDENGAFPYGLLENSPCINAGTPDTIGLFLPLRDLSGNTRIKEERIDIGCYEFQGNSAIIEYAKEELVFVSPNPVRDQAVFQFENSKLSFDAQLIIYHPNGSVIKCFEIGNQTSIQWDLKDESGIQLVSGWYLYHLVDGNFKYSGKILFSK